MCFKLKNTFPNKSVEANTVRDRPFNLQGGVWFFVSFRIFLRTTRELEIFFVIQNSTLGYMTKNHNPPLQVIGRSLTMYSFTNISVRKDIIMRLVS